MGLTKQPNIRFLSELYAHDAPDAILLPEYPSSNTSETRWQNRERYIIHDPFPPPRPELLKVLGPHHLMCAWGRDIPVTSQVAPPQALLEHWGRVFGESGCPGWNAFDETAQYITLFPHESIAADQQVVDPDINYAVHSKEVIQKIDCPQADVLSAVATPCIVKLSHGYAGLGNFVIRSAADEARMQSELLSHWPDATLVVNSIVENIVGDYGVQFYLRRDGEAIWLGLTEQNFTDNAKWCGGTFSAPLQDELFERLRPMVEATARYLHSQDVFGVIGIDILKDVDGGLFLVDVNPRLTGITPFLMASRMFAADEGWTEGIYLASCRFAGSLDQLISTAEAAIGGRVLVLSAFEDGGSTICHLSASADSQDHARQLLDAIRVRD